MPTSQPPDILSCEPEELAQYVLSERFDNNSKAAATFFLQAISSFPNAEALSAELTEEGEDESEMLLRKNLGDPLLSEDAVVEISMLSPRGKFSCRLFENGLVCENAKKESFGILPKDALQLVIFPKPEDVRKKGSFRDMILLTLMNEKVMFKNKTLSQLCFQLPNDAAFLENFRTSLNLTNDSTARVGGGSGWNFQSYMEGNTSTTTGGMPFVKCYQGVNDGHLYPLQEGLLFFKPALFIPRASLHSIACGRGASGSSRYVDMNITLDDENTLEFTNISREELGPLNEYINGTLIPAMKKDAVETNDTNDDEEETEAEEEEDDEAVATSRRSRRKASKEAREATKSQMLAKMEDNDDNDDDDDDDSWDAPYQQHNESNDDEEQDDDDDDENDSLELGQGDDGEEDDDDEVFFEEEDHDETEDEEDNGSRPTKRRR